MQLCIDFNKPAPISTEKIQEPVSGMPWVTVSKGIPYFSLETGASWTPIGQNDGITWPDLKGAFMEKDLSRVEAYLLDLSRNGITCLRLMLEYCQGEHRYLERPIGYFQPNMIQLWDNLFALCEKLGLRVLLTPYDTFWMWRRWSHHPYRHSHGGPCAKRGDWLVCWQTRKAIKNRLTFATRRWGGSGVLFAWDLWNEMHPSHSRKTSSHFYEFIEDISQHLRKTEQQAYGRTHLQTVSFFSPSLLGDSSIATCAFNHPSLDFASLHFYECNTIDRPKNTVDAALASGRMVGEALGYIKDGRPFFDSEHGPIQAYKDRRKMLPEAFDNEYFRHMQWAHFASGGAGGGLRWPYRYPHTLTTGMRQAQRALALFALLIDWKTFQRRTISKDVRISDSGLTAFACVDSFQAVVWLLRTKQKRKTGMVDKNAAARSFQLMVPGLEWSPYRITTLDTVKGILIDAFTLSHTTGDVFSITLPPVKTDLVIAITRIIVP